MAVSLLRRQSDTPTVQGMDDSRMFRYALSGYNGVTKDYNQECSYTSTGTTFTVNSGEVICDGWQAIIDANGVSVTIDNIATTRYYVVYLEYDLRTESPVITLKATYDTATYPTIAKGDDLTQNPSGVANVVLYRFQSLSGVISNVVAQFKLIEVGVVKKAENSERVKTKSGDFKTLQLALLEMIYPVGSIKISTNNVNPSTYLGGTWEQYSQGRVIVGAGTTTDSRKITKTFGAGSQDGEFDHRLIVKELPSHSHSYSYPDIGTGYGGITTVGVSGGSVSQTTGSTGGNIAHNNMQPYIVCYIWRRTS